MGASHEQLVIESVVVSGPREVSTLFDLKGYWNAAFSDFVTQSNTRDNLAKMPFRAIHAAYSRYSGSFIKCFSSVLARKK